MQDNVFFGNIARQLMKQLFSIESELFAKRFAELQIYKSKLPFKSKALVRGHRNSKCSLPHTPTLCQ